MSEEIQAPEVETTEAAPAAATEAAVEQTASDVLAEEKPAEAAEASTSRARRRAKHIPSGVAHIKATFNNTQVSITDPRGGVISWSTAGRSGFKGSRKSTAFAATVVAQDAARQAVAKGMHEVEVRMQGAGAGRESAVRGLQSAGLAVTMIRDVTPIAHNGCRARKRRRV
jgi:small subunit ribosomal protein S11